MMVNAAGFKRSLYISLFGHRGGFIYDRELGSRLYMSYPHSSGEEICVAYARDALGCFPGCEVIGVSDEGIRVEADGQTFLIESE